MAYQKSTCEKNAKAAVRICICTQLWLGLYNGGVDRIVRFARNVSRQGADVYLIDRSRKKSLSGLFLDGDRYIEIKNGKYRECKYPFSVRFLFPGLIKFLQEALNRWFSLLTRSSISEVSYSFLVDPYLFVKLFFVCRKERIEIIQCEFPFPIFASFILKKIVRIPLVYDAHNIESERISGMPNVNRVHAKLMLKIETVSCKICDAVFVVSEDDCDRLVHLGIPERKVTIIANSVELEQFSVKTTENRIRDKYKLGKEALIVIFHGFLSYPPNKEAAHILLALFKRILEKHDFVYLFLVGENPPETVQRNVIVTGFVKDITEYITAADVAAAPLLSGGGTKLKMLEYMACGKAIVSTFKAAEGIDLENGSDALMSRYPDTEFVQLLLKCIEDVELRNKIGQNARKKAERLYDWKQNAKKAVCIYENLTQRQD